MSSFGDARVTRREQNAFYGTNLEARTIVEIEKTVTKDEMFFGGRDKEMGSALMETKSIKWICAHPIANFLRFPPNLPDIFLLDVTCPGSVGKTLGYPHS